ncbi:MAG: hypothetical protein ABIM62_06780, partial [candidate division WOR-3 bacterium]
MPDETVALHKNTKTATLKVHQAVMIIIMKEFSRNSCPLSVSVLKGNIFNFSKISNYFFTEDGPRIPQEEYGYKRDGRCDSCPEANQHRFWYGKDFYTGLITKT